MSEPQLSELKPELPFPYFSFEIMKIILQWSDGSQLMSWRSVCKAFNYIISNDIWKGAKPIFIFKNATITDDLMNSISTSTHINYLRFEHCSRETDMSFKTFYNIRGLFLKNIRFLDLFPQLTLSPKAEKFKCLNYFYDLEIMLSALKCSELKCIEIMAPGSKSRFSNVSFLPPLVPCIRQLICNVPIHFSDEHLLNPSLNWMLQLEKVELASWSGSIFPWKRWIHWDGTISKHRQIIVLNSMSSCPNLTKLNFLSYKEQDSEETIGFPSHEQVAFFEAMSNDPHFKVIDFKAISKKKEIQTFN